MVESTKFKEESKKFKHLTDNLSQDEDDTEFFYNKEFVQKCI